MFRRSGTTTHAGNFSESIIEAIWHKAQVQLGYDSRMYRKDRCEAWMKRSAYGTTGEYGWEIDHILPVSKGGEDEMINLQPLHWRNNRGKGDDYPRWYCTLPQKV